MDILKLLSRRGGGGFGGRGRRIVEYHDLDAPADMEFWIASDIE